MAKRMIPRLRFGMFISKEEYTDRNLTMAREFMSEMYMMKEYIGWLDIDDGVGARIFFFDNDDAAARAVKIARSIGFDITGRTENIVILNTDMNREHIDRYRNRRTFLREYYR